MTCCSQLWPFLWMICHSQLWPFHEWHVIHNFMNDTVSNLLWPLWTFLWMLLSKSNGDHFLWMTLSRSNCDLFCEWHYLDLIVIFMNFLWMILSRSSCDIFVIHNCDLFCSSKFFVTFLSFVIMHPDWYLNWGPLDLQSNTLSFCHYWYWYLE